MFSCILKKTKNREGTRGNKWGRKSKPGNSEFSGATLPVDRFVASVSCFRFSRIKQNRKIGGERERDRMTDRQTDTEANLSGRSSTRYSYIPLFRWLTSPGDQHIPSYLHVQEQLVTVRQADLPLSLSLISQCSRGVSFCSVLGFQFVFLSVFQRTSWGHWQEGVGETAVKEREKEEKMERKRETV